ncbi:MAG: zf-TFIIB domain-containing protein [Fibrobacterota bacterium]
MRVICEKCGHETAGVVHTCPICGGRMTKPVPKTLRCPRCGISLNSDAYRSHNIHRCGRCGGFWVSERSFAVLTSECDVYRDETVSPEYDRPAFPREDPYLVCPSCTEIMNRFNFGGGSAVMIDTCAGCGYWLDAGELEKIREFIAAGGLQQRQNSQITANSSDIRMLQQDVGEIKMMQNILHKFKKARIFLRGF